MFAITRKTTSKGRDYEYVQIIENYRVGKKVKQRIILSLGRKDKLDPSFVDTLIQTLEQFGKESVVLSKEEPAIDSSWSKAHGIPLLYQKLWEKTGLEEIIAAIAQTRKQQFKLERAIFLIVLNRLMDPKSEHAIDMWKDHALYLSTSESTRERGDFHDLELHHLYRSLDVVEEEKETIETKLFQKTRNLFNTEVTLAFFDTTSTYYEGTGKESKELLRYGKSKDHRSDRKQITVGVLLDQQGIPIGCEINQGNTQDATAIKQMIDSVKKRFTLKDVIWVADSGMAGEENIEKMRKCGQRFILGARMKNVKELYEKIEDHKTHQRMKAAMKPVPDKKGLFFDEFLSEKHGGRKYVLVYNEKEAKRERETREKITKKLQEVLKQKQGVKKLIANKKYRSYLKIEGTSTVAVDEERLKRDARYDGLFVLQTDTDLETTDVITRYKDLYQIEQAFRNLKSSLDVRPIYHRKDRRITAHVFVAFLALYLQMTLERLLKEKGMSRDDIVHGLTAVQQVYMNELSVKECTYYLRTRLPKEAHEIFRHVGVHAGKRIRLMT